MKINIPFGKPTIDKKEISLVNKVLKSGNLRTWFKI